MSNKLTQQDRIPIAKEMINHRKQITFEDLLLAIKHFESDEYFEQQHSLKIQMDNALNSLQKSYMNVCTQVLKQLLKREPTDQDWSKFSKSACLGLTIDFYILFEGIILGKITHLYEEKYGFPTGVKFEPAALFK